MKDYRRALKIWKERLKAYGIRNSYTIKRNLKRERLFSLRLNHREFYLRGNTVDFDVFNSIIVKGEYDIDLGFAPEIIVDAGANIGASAIYFRMRYPGAVIYAIEPETSNFDLLKKNLAGYSNVVTEKFALWPERRDLFIANPDADKYAFRINETGEMADSVAGLTVEDLMKKWTLPRIDLLKMDIEGAEKRLFELPGTPWMRKVRALVVELHDLLEQGTTDAFRRAMTNIDCRIFQKGENYVVINNSFRNE